MNQLPTYIDRYPAKMISRLADDLIEQYCAWESNLLDPFCGSGAVLLAGAKRGIPVTGLDVNPYAVLLSNVKLNGFNAERAQLKCEELIREASSVGRGLSINWDSKYFWFTPLTLNKYERLRKIARDMELAKTAEGRAVILAFALSIRRCSRADQRSPKPFISKLAKLSRSKKHFDPFKEIPLLLDDLSELYHGKAGVLSTVHCIDVTSKDKMRDFMGQYSQIITSPPYINAQDYFRNFKLELHLLEGLLPFAVNETRYAFIGTERGDLLSKISASDLLYNRTLLPEILLMERTHPRLSQVVHRYLADMAKCFDFLKKCLKKRGTLIIVCGDNLVGGYQIPTWALLDTILQQIGFEPFDRFGDRIDRRMLPPKRQGHKGLIKQEVVSAYRLIA